jgi:hypothetical protein
MKGAKAALISTITMLMLVVARQSRGDCACSGKKNHETHVNIVAAVTVHAPGRPIKDELAGSVVRLCRHAQQHQVDALVFHNEVKPARELEIVFRMKPSPLVGAPDTIVVSSGQTSPAYAIDTKTSKGTWYWYDWFLDGTPQNPKQSPVMSPRNGKRDPNRYPQPGPAVIVDE